MTGYNKPNPRDDHMTEKHRKEVAAALKEADTEDTPRNVSNPRLASFLDRVRRLTEEQKALGEDIKDVFSEAKATGFEPKIMKRILKLEKLNKEKAREELELLELYAAGAGIDLPLFSIALK